MQLEKQKATSEDKTVVAEARKAPGEKKNCKASKSPLKAKRSNKSPTEKPKHLNPNVPSQVVVPLHQKAASKKLVESFRSPVKKK